MELGLSQKHVGNELGVSFQQIQKYESEKNQVPLSKLLALANVLSVPMTYFFEPYDKSSYSPIQSKDGLKLIQRFEAIQNKEVRKAILSFVDEISQSYVDAG